MGHIRSWNPYLWQMPVQTCQREENAQLSRTYLVVLTFSFTGLDRLGKACTCPFTDSDMRDLSDMKYFGTRVPLPTRELISWLLINWDHLYLDNLLSHVLAAILFSRGSRVNNENCKANPGVGQ